MALGKPALPLFMVPNMAAGLWTTAGDYARFLAHTRRYPALSTPTTPVKGTLDWGLGWGLGAGGWSGVPGSVSPGIGVPMTASPTCSSSISPRARRSSCSPTAMPDVGCMSAPPAPSSRASSMRSPSCSNAWQSCAASSYEGSR